MTSFPRLSFSCPIPWDAMRGDERERYCSKCSRTVRNLSLLTATEREALLANPPTGGLCVAYYRRLSGELVRAENPLTAAESKNILPWGVAAAVIAAAAIGSTVAPHMILGSSTPPAVANSSWHNPELTRYTTAVSDFIEEKILGIPKPPPSAGIILGMMACPPASASGSLAPSAPQPASAPAPTLPATQSI